MNYLNEEKYIRTKNKIKLIGILILVIGFSIGGFLIYKGVSGGSATKLEDEKAKLEEKKAALKEKGITPSNNYENGEAYDLYILTEVLNPSYDQCWRDEYKNNSLTKDYCKIKNAGSDYNKHVLIGVGGMICWISFIVSIMTIVTAKRREIMAYHMQSVMPVGKEALEDIQPTVSKVSKKHMEEMGPAIGELAKEITKGVKQGLKDDEKEDK